MTEGADGIDAGGTTGGAETCEQCDCNEQDCGPCEGEGIGGGEAVEHGADEARETEGNDDSDEDSGDGHP